MATEISLTTDATAGVLYDASSWNITVMDILYCLIAVLGIIGNGLVLYVFFKERQLRVTTNILISHQSLVDFISSFLLPVTFIPSESNLATLNEQIPFLSSSICKIWYSKYVFWTFIKISTINLVLLTLERYFAVLHPRQYRKRATKRSLALVCAVSWLLGAMMEVYLPIIHKVHGNGDCTSRHIHQGKRVPIAYLSLLTTLLIPTFVMVFVYASIIRFLRRREATSVVYRHHSAFSENVPTSSSAYRHHLKQPLPQPSSPMMTRIQNDVGAHDELRLRDEQDTTISEDGMTLEPLSKSALSLAMDTQCSTSIEYSAVHIRKKKPKTSADVASRNILITMFIVCVTYVVCWAPDMLLYWHHSVVKVHDWSQPSYRIAILLAFGNVCTNPVIYTLNYRSFQNGLKSVFGRRSTSQFG